MPHTYSSVFGSAIDKKVFIFSLLFFCFVCQPKGKEINAGMGVMGRYRRVHDLDAFCDDDDVLLEIFLLSEAAGAAALAGVAAGAAAVEIGRAHV